MEIGAVTLTCSLLRFFFKIQYLLEKFVKDFLTHYAISLGLTAKICRNFTYTEYFYNFTACFKGRIHCEIFLSRHFMKC